jgi:CheY-like chemotaxis protein
MAGARLLLTVEDTGIGIAPERLASIFEEFEQADSSAMNAHGGTGLGLAISQRIVAQMGGSIGVESVPGLGSTFRVTLPCTPLSPASNDKVPDLAGQTIRIISRQPFEARFLEERLGRCGALVQRVSGGEDGPLPRADVLLLDAALGRETARVLAEAARAAGTPERLVMLSPYERRDFGALQELGFTGYLVKPIRERSLHARLGPALPHRSVERELPSPAAAVLAGQRILLAEDNPINALIARKHLESLGAEVVWASDGLEAARLAEAAIDGEARRFEAMLCDFRMPGLDGLSLARRLRAHEALRRAPPVRMLAVTANAFAEDREAAMAAGYDAFVPKPVDRERLAEALGVTLGVAA